MKGSIRLGDKVKLDWHGQAERYSQGQQQRGWGCVYYSKCGNWSTSSQMLLG